MQLPAHVRALLPLPSRQRLASCQASRRTSRPAPWAAADRHHPTAVKGRTDGTPALLRAGAVAVCPLPQHVLQLRLCRDREGPGGSRRAAGTTVDAARLDPVRYSRLVWRARMSSSDSCRAARTRLVTRSAMTKRAISYALPIGRIAVDPESSAIVCAAMAAIWSARCAGEASG